MNKSSSDNFDEQSTQNIQETQNNFEINLENPEFELSNLHIIYSKEYNSSVHFGVSPMTSVSSPFTENDILDLLNSDNQDIEKNNSLQISDNSVAFRQYIDIELNYNFEFSQVSSFHENLLPINQNSIEETQNIDIHEISNHGNDKDLSCDCSTKYFEKIDNSDENFQSPEELKEKDSFIENEKILDGSSSDTINDDNNNSNETQKNSEDSSDFKKSNLTENDKNFNLHKDTNMNNNENYLSNSLRDNNNELEICQVSQNDFNTEEGKNVDAHPILKKSGFETIISFNNENRKDDKVSLNFSDTISTESKYNEKKKTTLKDSLTMTNISADNLKDRQTPSVEKTTSNFPNQNSLHKHETNENNPPNKQIPHFSTSDPLTMANIRYSPQIYNLKNSGVLYTESNNAFPIQESNANIMTAINYSPVQLNIQKDPSIYFEKAEISESNKVVKKQIKAKKINKKQHPSFTMSNPSTMANIRYSPQNNQKAQQLQSEEINLISSKKGDALISQNQEQIIEEEEYESSNFLEEEQIFDEGEIDELNIKESSISEIVSINLDKSEEGNDNEMTENLKDEIIEEEENPEYEEIIGKDKNNVNQKKAKIGKNIKKHIVIPHFTTSELSSMANIRFSPQNTSSSFSIQETGDQLNDSSSKSSFTESSIDTISSRKSIPLKKEIQKSSEFSLNKNEAKSKQKTNKNIPAFNTSNPSIITEINYSSNKIKLKQSQSEYSEFIELNDDSIMKDNQESDDNIHGNIKIDQSDLIAITSINYISNISQDHKNKLKLSKKIVIEKEKEEKEKIVSANQKINKSKKKENIPIFTSSEPSIMTNINYSSTKEKLEPSKSEFLEINNDSENLDDNDRNINTNESSDNELSSEININESEVATIASVNYIPYSDQEQKSKLNLSKQISVESPKNVPENQKNYVPKGKASSTNKTKSTKNQNIPTFTSSEPSIMTNINYSSTKGKLEQSKSEFSEVKDESPENISDSDSNMNINQYSNDELSNGININESELTTITSINYIPYSDQKQKNKLNLSKQISIESPNKESNKRNNSNPKAQETSSTNKTSTKNKEIPTFTSSEPSIMTNINYSSTKEKLEPSKSEFLEINIESPENISDSDSNININQCSNDELSNEININESELTTITSINYIPYSDQEQKNKLNLSKQISIESPNKESNKRNNSNPKAQKAPSNKATSTKKIEIPTFTSSEPSIMTNINYSSTKEKLEPSKSEFLEINNDSENLDDNDRNINTNESSDNELSSEININESELTTITSINYIPYSDQKQKNKLNLSKQISIESPNKEPNKRNNSNPKAQETSSTNKTSTKNKEIPTFTSSEPSIMTNINYSSTKEKLEPSKSEFLEINIESPENIIDTNPNTNTNKSSDNELSSEINIDESELTTIASINYIPYSDQEQKNKLNLSKQISIESQKNVPENQNFSFSKAPNNSKENKTKSANDRKNPKFNVSELSAITSQQLEYTKEKLQNSKISVIESSFINESKSDDILNQNDEKVNKININQSDLNRIISINYIPISDRNENKSLNIFEQQAIQSDPMTNKHIKSPGKIITSTPKKIPKFISSDPSIITNIQSMPFKEEQDHIDSFQPNNDYSNKNLEPFQTDEKEEEINSSEFIKEEEEIEEFINIEESEITTIVSIRFKPEEYEENNISENEYIDKSNDKNDNENLNHFTTPKRESKKRLPHFTSSNIQSNNFSSKSSIIKNPKEQKIQRKEVEESNDDDSNPHKFSFEKSEIDVVSESRTKQALDKSCFFTTDIQNSLENPILNQIGTQITSNNNSKLTLNDNFTIESANSSIDNQNNLPNFEFSELTASAHKNDSKASLKQSQPLYEQINFKEEENSQTSESKMSHNGLNNSNENEISQTISFENPSAQNPLEPSNPQVSESFNFRQKKNIATKKPNKKNMDQALSLSKNEDLFIDNSKDNGIDNNEPEKQPKKKRKTKNDTKLTQNIQQPKGISNRSETSIQTSNDDLINHNHKSSMTINHPESFDIELNDNYNKTKVIDLSKSEPHYVETDNNKREKSHKKSKQIPDQELDPSNSKERDILDDIDEKDKKSSLSLSNSLSCDNNSNQNLPQFEESIITTISNISLNATDTEKDSIHLSFQENPSLLIEESQKEKTNDNILLFNSPIESFQSETQENNQLSMAKSEFDIVPNKKSKTIKKKLNNSKTQTDSNKSFSMNNQEFLFDLPIKEDASSLESNNAQIPQFENSNPTTILSLNKSEEVSTDFNKNKKEDKPVDYSQASTQATTNLTNQSIETQIKSTNDLKPSEPIVQKSSNENNFVQSEAESLVNIDSFEEMKQNHLNLNLNETIFDKKMELTNDPQYEISEKDIKIETNDPSTLVSIQLREPKYDFKITNQKQVEIVNEIGSQNNNVDSKKENQDRNDLNNENLSLNLHHSAFDHEQLESNSNNNSRFELSDMVSINDLISRDESNSLNFDRNINNFTISETKKTFHESSPLSIFLSNKEDKIQDVSNNHNNEYSNNLLFDLKPEKVKDSQDKNVDFQQSEFINILSINKEIDQQSNTNNLDPVDINIKENKSELVQKNIVMTDSYQKVEQSESNEKIVYEESNPLTLISIYKKDPEVQHPKCEFSSNMTVFNTIDQDSHQQVETENSVSCETDKKPKNAFLISNPLSFEKSAQIKMTKVYGSLYVKPQANSLDNSNETPKASLSLDNDTPFFFEENCNNNTDDEIKSVPLKTSRSLENLDSFSIEKNKRSLSMVFGSFYVNSNIDENKNDTNNAKKISISTSTEDLKKNMNTVFGCFEIQSPLIEPKNNPRLEIKDASSQTTKDEEGFSEINTSNDINAPPQTTNTDVSKIDNSSNTEKNQFSLTNVFGRFDISPGTYDIEKSDDEETKPKAIKDANKALLSFTQANSLFIENNKTENNQEIIEEEEEDRSDSDQQIVTKEVLNENDKNKSNDFQLFSSEIVDLNKVANTNLEQLYLNSINIEPTNLKPLQNSSISTSLKIGQNQNSIDIPEIGVESNEKGSNLEKLSLNSINIEPTIINQKNGNAHLPLEIDQGGNSINVPEDDVIDKEDSSNLEQISLNSINIEPSKNRTSLTSLEIEQGFNSINVPEDQTDDEENSSHSDQKSKLYESKKLSFEIPLYDGNNNFDLSLNQSEFQIQPQHETSQESSKIPKREIVENKSFEIPLIHQKSVIQKQYNEKNVSIEPSFPTFFEFSNYNFNELQKDDDKDDPLLSISNLNGLYIPPLIEEEEEDIDESKGFDLNSPIFSNIELCKKLIAKQMSEIKVLEREVVKKDVAYESLNHKFDLFKESTRNMLTKHFGEIRSLNEKNSKLVSQIDSLQTRLSSKNEAVYSHFKQKTAICSFSDFNEIISVEPKPDSFIEKRNSNSNKNNNLLVTFTVEDLEPSMIQMEKLLQSSNSNRLVYSNRNGFGRRLFISNPSSYDDIGLFSNLPLLRESGKITQFSLHPKRAFIPLKVDANLNFEKKEVKPELTFSFYHLRVTRPKFFPPLHLEDNLTVAHILPQKTSKNSELQPFAKTEIRRNIERSQIFIPGEDEQENLKRKEIKTLPNVNKCLSFYSPNSLSIEPKPLKVYTNPKLRIKKTQSISFIAQKKQK